MVPSSPSFCVGAISSRSMSGGDGAMASSSSPMSALPFADDGAVGAGSTFGTRGVTGGIGGEFCVRPGKFVSMNRACGET
eukprot:4491277-Pleurochrysis_carterae.AAC.1